MANDRRKNVVAKAHNIWVQNWPAAAIEPVAGHEIPRNQIRVLE